MAAIHTQTARLQCVSGAARAKMKKQVICIFWGTKYSPEYVNRLYRGVARHTTPPFTFHCITDSTEQFDEGVETIPLPEMGCEMPTGTWGIWGKSRLWSERLGDLSGPVLFLDIDSVIVGSLDPFFDFGDPNDVIAARNPNRPHERMGQTSLFRFPVGKLAPMREKFLSDPQGIADEYRFEQRFLTRNAPGGISFWPRGWVAVFRWHCIQWFPLNYFFEPRKPKKARVVIFPGRLNPTDAIKGRWEDAYPAMNRRDYLAAIFTQKRGERAKLWSHLRHFLFPTKWVAEAWYGTESKTGEPSE